MANATSGRVATTRWMCASRAQPSGGGSDTRCSITRSACAPTDGAQHCHQSRGQRRTSMASNRASARCLSDEHSHWARESEAGARHVGLETASSTARNLDLDFAQLARECRTAQAARPDRLNWVGHSYFVARPRRAAPRLVLRLCSAAASIASRSRPAAARTSGR
jgi:hypothetical protein